MDYVFYLSILCNVFSILGVAGILQQQRELITAYFTYNAVQMVSVFHFFVDICADIGIRFRGESASTDGYEQAAASAYCLMLEFCQMCDIVNICNPEARFNVVVCSLHVLHLVPQRQRSSLLCSGHERDESEATRGIP